MMNACLKKVALSIVSFIFIFLIHGGIAAAQGTNAIWENPTIQFEPVWIYVHSHRPEPAWRRR